MLIRARKWASAPARLGPSRWHDDAAMATPPQHLKRVLLKYCLHSGSSRGVRFFLERELLAFAREHPSIRVDVAIAPGRHPTMLAEFATGAPPRLISLRKATPAHVLHFLHRVRDMSGWRVRKFTQNGMGQTPSVQGEWMPFHALERPHEVVLAGGGGADGGGGAERSAAGAAAGAR